MAQFSVESRSYASRIAARDAAIIAPTYGKADIGFVAGSGSRLVAEDGRTYLDFVGGIAVNSLGYGHPAVIAAIEAQARRFLHISNLYPSGPQVELAELLAQLWGGGKVFFCNSGTEANEGAIKFARKWFDRKGDAQRIEIVSFLGSFHGRTYGALAATGQDGVKQGFGPMPAGFRHVPWNDAAALESVVGSSTAAVLIEPIAAEGGVMAPSPEFLAELQRLRKKHGFLVIADEIQTGLGRLGRNFGSEVYGIQPDMATLAKALGGGLPLGAVLLSSEIADSLKPGDHGTTFGGNPVSCAAGLATIRIISDDGFLAQVRARSQQLKSGLADLARKHPQVAGEFAADSVRGEGLLLGLRCKSKPIADVVAEARRRGLLVHRAGADVLRLLPPLIVTEADCAEALATLDAAMAALG